MQYCEFSKYLTISSNDWLDEFNYAVYNDLDLSYAV